MLKNRMQLAAFMDGFIVSLFVTSELAGILLVFAYLLPAGIQRTFGYGFASVFTLVFFVWFWRWIYRNLWVPEPCDNE